MARTADPTDIPKRLLSAGLELLLRQGYNATGIQEIADQAGVPKGSFYNHFASKEVFAAAIVDRYAEHSRLSWERMMRGAPAEPMAAIRHVFAQMLDYHEQASCPAGCLIGNLAAEISPVQRCLPSEPVGRAGCVAAAARGLDQRRPGSRRNP